MFSTVYLGRERERAAYVRKYFLDMLKSCKKAETANLKKFIKQYLSIMNEVLLYLPRIKMRKYQV